MQSATFVDVRELRTIRARCKTPNCGGAIELPIGWLAGFGFQRTDRDPPITCRFCGSAWFPVLEDGKGADAIKTLAQGICNAQQIETVDLEFVIPASQGAAQPSSRGGSASTSSFDRARLLADRVLTDPSPASPAPISEAAATP